LTELQRVQPGCSAGDTEVLLHAYLE
jgi:hypothetical protein